MRNAVEFTCTFLWSQMDDTEKSVGLYNFIPLRPSLSHLPQYPLYKQTDTYLEGRRGVQKEINGQVLSGKS